MTDILDIRPLIKRKQQSQCPHEHASVSDSAVELTCDDCEAEIDPWWFLRRMAREPERMLAEHEARRAVWDAMEAEGTRRIELLNATIVRLNADIERLTETKNRLWNEQVNGRPLGSVTLRPRRRARKATP